MPYVRPITAADKRGMKLVMKRMKELAGEGEHMNKYTLARKLGLTRQAVSNWKRVPVEKVIQISRALDLDPCDLRPDIYPDDLLTISPRLRSNARADAK